MSRIAQTISPSDRLTFATTDHLHPPGLGSRRSCLHLPMDRSVHADLFASMTLLHQVEVATPRVPAPALDSAAKVVFWNAERCKFLDEAASLMRSEAPDIILLAEMDHGMARSGQRHTTRDLARLMGAGYAFGVEFVELSLGNARERESCAGLENEAGLHGGAIVSRQPLKRPALVRLEQDGSWWNGVNGNQRRIGGRIALLATVTVAGRDVVFVSVHLESHSAPEARAEQMAALIDSVNLYAPGLPVVMGGDFNTCTLRRPEESLVEHRIALEKEEPGRFIRPRAVGNRCSTSPTGAATNWVSCNRPDRPTQRTRPDGKPEPPLGRLDWMFTRDLKAREPEVGGGGRWAGAQAISDHDMVTVVVEPRSALRVV